ncbi:PEBP-like protein [Wolfiporia cocos MD-104 SS10]|uniref:PEBP-like protein n=1 Tax=Wolfiporia cocos (strain MD-104) TaxID=742152 RepID=A0A2H3ISX4_WOLCO|nr:PEBP-like protein [Wolfiporia cocos MD-104 SS10]
MFAVRRLPWTCTRLSGIRGNASLRAATDSVTPPPPPLSSTPAPKPAASPQAESAPAEAEQEPAEEKGKQPQREREWPTRRPRISLEHPRQWNRPIAKGVLPAYDFALEYVRADSDALDEELKQLRETIRAAIAVPEGERDVQRIEELKEKARILEIQSEANLPDVRWKAWNGMADMKKLVYRHLLEQRWREDGALDLLMERIHQMGVVPDLLPSLHPSLDLRVNYPEPPPKSVYLRTRVKRRYQKVEPGIFLLPQQTWKPPMLYTTVFHTDTRLYTLLMVDLDVPDPDNRTFTTYLHWMQPNVALSALSPSPIPLSNSHTPYVPPHPQKGTRYHRYVILLLPQEAATERIHVPVLTDEERVGFDLRQFAAKYGLDGAKGGGAHMWREVWDETVSKIYTDVLKTEEPRYGYPPKYDLYAELKLTKKYV